VRGQEEAVVGVRWGGGRGRQGTVAGRRQIRHADCKDGVCVRESEDEDESTNSQSYSWSVTSEPEVTAAPEQTTSRKGHNVAAGSTAVGRERGRR
jgi:hypothetical protein